MRKEIKFEDVLSVYSGRHGCACGCRGKHSFRSDPAMRDQASRFRGYEVGEDEVSDRSIKIITGKFNKAAREGKLTQVDDKIISFETDTRLYILTLA